MRTGESTLRIGNTVVETGKVREFVEAFGASHGLPVNVVNDVCLCLDELLNNTITYGYPDQGRHSISISLRTDGHALLAELEDDARPFDPRRPRSRPPSGDLANRSRGGLGLHFVNALMDEVDYVWTGEYNRVRIKKKV